MNLIYLKLFSYLEAPICDVGSINDIKSNEEIITTIQIH